MSEKNRNIAPLVESISESTVACLVTMAQGNVLALTAGHLLIASQTGLIAGALAGVTIIAAKVSNRWVVSALLGVTTAVVDYLIHPGMFGSVATEAIVTGIGAALLSFLVGTLLRRWRARTAQAG